jgi:hypothetical protein
MAVVRVWAEDVWSSWSAHHLTVRRWLEGRWLEGRWLERGAPD